MAWTAPNILSLNAWMQKAWNMTWAPTRPLSHLNSIALWKAASSDAPPPEPFLPDLQLFETIDETYTVLVRHGLPTTGSLDSPTPLLSWRRKVMQIFEAQARDLGCFHPAYLPRRLAQAIREGTVPLPESVLLVAFEAPAPLEEQLFRCLANACALRRYELPAGAPEKTECVVLPSRKQEVAWLTRQVVLDAQALPLNRIGVVVPDTEIYVPMIEQAFGEVMGESFMQTRAAYNISAGTPLLQRTLVQSGLLPLRFWVEGQPRTLLLALVLSTYYDRWVKSRNRIARADTIWRKHGLDSGLRPLLRTLADEAPQVLSLLSRGDPTLQQALETFLHEPHRTGAEWVRILETFWAVAGYPVIADEADLGAWRHLKIILGRIREDLHETPLGLADFTWILHHLLSEEPVHVRGSEEAGIQVLGIIESRGLSFEKLYVVGLSAGSLPRPLRPLPLLDAWERRRVRGATAESQYVFGQDAFRHLLACAPHVTLLRPKEEAAEPLSPSPFWSQTDSDEVYAEVDHWNAPDSVWARVTWLQQAYVGLERPAVFPPSDCAVDGDLLPKTISVSNLITAYVCPFRFFAEMLLEVFPLDEPVMGISPKERGSFIHRALALFTRRCRDQALKGKNDRTTMEALLERCCDQVLLSVAGEHSRKDLDELDRHSRSMERRRWIGSTRDVAGLLMQWLDMELQRHEEGWSWLFEESSFDGLNVPGFPCSIAGRIDRIDHHTDKGIMLWDYKSGEYPTRRAVGEQLIDPQIPAYILAATRHRIAELEAQFEKGIKSGLHISGGYIALNKPSSVGHKDITPKGGSWNQVLDQWEQSLAGLGQMLVSGRFEASPYPVSAATDKEKACQYCPYKPLCGRRTPMA
jgi:RecB family exonuclease